MVVMGRTWGVVDVTGTGITTTLAFAAPVGWKPLPVIVRVVPPPMLPLEGDTEETDRDSNRGWPAATSTAPVVVVTVR